MKAAETKTPTVSVFFLRTPPKLKHKSGFFPKHELLSLDGAKAIPPGRKSSSLIAEANVAILIDGVTKQKVVNTPSSTTEALWLYLKVSPQYCAPGYYLKHVLTPTSEFQVVTETQKVVYRLKPKDIAVLNAKDVLERAIFISYG